MYTANYHKAILYPFSNAIANRINGKLFLELKDGSMSDLSLSYGFKRLVYGLLEKV